MTCKELVEVITDYLEDRLPAGRGLLFEEHVAFCSWCQTYLDQMRETIRVTGTLREDDLGLEPREAFLDAFRTWNTDGQ